MRPHFRHSVFVLMVLCFCFSCTKTEVDPAKNISTSPILFFRIGQGSTLTSMEQTSDGGNILCGYEFTGGSKNTDGFLLKTDSKGNVQWKQTYGGPEDDQFNKVQQTSDGGYIMVGTTNSYGNGATRGDFYLDAWVVKTDANGNILWQKTFGDIYSDVFYDVTELPDHSLVAVGYFVSYNLNYGAYSSIAYIAKLDQTGNVLYSSPVKQLQTKYRSHLSGVVVTPTGFAVIVRVVKSINLVDQATLWPFVAGFGGANGTTLLWSKIDSGIGTAAIVSRIINTGDGLLTAMQSNDAVSTIQVFKTDYKGALLWNKPCKTSGTNFLTSFNVNANGGYLVGGYSYGAVYSASVPYLLSIDAGGDVTNEADIAIDNYSLGIQNAIATSNGFDVGLSITSNVLNKGNQFGLAHIDNNGKLKDYAK